MNKGHHSSVKHSNLKYIKCEKVCTSKALINFGLLNAQSCKNKCDSIVDYVREHSLDFLVITEPWLTQNDKIAIANLTADGYKCLSVPRVGRKGGGLALIYSNSLSLSSKSRLRYKSFEWIELSHRSSGHSVLVLVIYRPPPTKKNGTSTSLFMEELSKHIDQFVLSTEDVLMLGDFNFHVDVQDDRDAIIFMNILDSVNLTQHVHEQTHFKGHTLDLVISQSGNPFLPLSGQTSSFLNRF